MAFQPTSSLARFSSARMQEMQQAVPARGIAGIARQSRHVIGAPRRCTMLVVEVLAGWKS
jgi:hypothetical protein